MGAKKKKRNVRKETGCRHLEKTTKASVSSSNRNVSKHYDKWVDDYETLDTTLRQYGLLIHPMAKDGNCLFRSMADQFGLSDENNEDGHLKLRKEVVEHLKANKELYEGFIEDGQSFDDYCATLSNWGSWGGQLELQIMSILYQVNILVHQANGRSWSLENFSSSEMPCAQLAYHNGDHYNSVRFLHDRNYNSPAHKESLDYIRKLGTNNHSVNFSNFKMTDGIYQNIAESNKRTDDSVEPLYSYKDAVLNDTQVQESSSTSIEERLSQSDESQALRSPESDQLNGIFLPDDLPIRRANSWPSLSYRSGCSYDDKVSLKELPIRISEAIPQLTKLELRPLKGPLHTLPTATVSATHIENNSRSQRDRTTTFRKGRKRKAEAAKIKKLARAQRRNERRGIAAEVSLEQSPLQQSPLQQSFLQQSFLQQSFLQQSPLQQSPLQQSPLQQSISSVPFNKRVLTLDIVLKDDLSTLERFRRCRSCPRLSNCSLQSHVHYRTGIVNKEAHQVQPLATSPESCPNAKTYIRKTKAQLAKEKGLRKNQKQMTVITAPPKSPLSKAITLSMSSRLKLSQLFSFFPEVIHDWLL